MELSLVGKSNPYHSIHDRATVESVGVLRILAFFGKWNIQWSWNTWAELHIFPLSWTWNETCTLSVFCFRHGPSPEPPPVFPPAYQHAGLSVSCSQRAVWLVEAGRGASSCSVYSTSSSHSSACWKGCSVWDGHCRWEVFGRGKADGA